MALPAILEPPTCTRLNNYGGFTTNMRGVLAYTTNMDMKDNPAMIPELKGAYSVTTSHMEFLPTQLKTGKECFPEVQVGQSGFTHTEGGKALGDYTGSVRAHKEKANAAYKCGPHLTSACTLDPGMATETKESFGYNISNRGEFSQPNILIGERESGFTRNDARPFPTDGRVLDPVYVGQYPSFGKFGPSTTTIDYPPHTHSIHSGKEFTLPCSSKTDRRSGFWQERFLPTCVTKGAIKNYCHPLEGYLTTYQLHYPRRSCNSDYTGFAVSGKPIDPLAVLPTINLFNGNGYYITETMESFSDIPQKRVQLYPDKMATAYNPSIFPANSSCPPKPDCADQRNILACTQPTQARRSCSGSCTINT